MASLATTQYRWPLVLQIADIFGSYGVTFLLVLVAACIARMLPSEGRPCAWWPAAVAVIAIGATLAYGQRRIGETPTEPGPKVALIQGSIDIDMKHDPTQSQRIFDEYFDLSRRAARENGNLDLMVWPETMFRYPWFIFEEGYQPAPDTLTAEEAIGRSHRAIANTVEPLGVPLLLGIDTVYGTAAKREPIRYNSALFVDAHGRELARYDKCHPVMFGEYVPFAETFPWLYALTPLAGGLASGDEPLALKIGNVRYAPNICFEDTLPHLIRRQVLELRAQGEEPDVLVNLTNDGWFWGSSELDMHLACAVAGGRVPQAAVDCRQHGLLGLDRFGRAHSRPRPAPHVRCAGG